jgi:hypothetical protein
MGWFSGTVVASTPLAGAALACGRDKCANAARCAAFCANAAGSHTAQTTVSKATSPKLHRTHANLLLRIGFIAPSLFLAGFVP